MFATLLRQGRGGGHSPEAQAPDGGVGMGGGGRRRQGGWSEPREKTAHKLTIKRLVAHDEEK